MKLYSYIIIHDSGFAPNPLWGFCTLACCKPNIRRTAGKGDWVVGISSRSRGNQVVYAMEVTEQPLMFQEYFGDPRFRWKIPDLRRKEIVFRCGDNIYRPTGDDQFEQLPNPYHGESEFSHDLAGRNVLVSDHFFYFGRHGVRLPDDLEALIAGRGHKSRFPPATVHRFLEFIHGHRRGVAAAPTKWPDHDSSWDQSANTCS